MSRRGPNTKILATMLLLSVPLLGVPARAVDVELSGTVVSVVDKAPLAGARVYAADTRTGEVFQSEPSNADGGFRLAGLPAGSLELAVGIDDGLYLVQTPVTLAPAQSQQVSIAVNEKKKKGESDGWDESSTVPTKSKTSAWNNPLTAALIVVGAAIVLGAIITVADDDDDDASPF